MTLRVVRGLGGALSAGLWLLALVVAGAWVAAEASYWRGPGGVSALVHVGAAVVVTALQTLCDRRDDAVAAVAGIGVLAITGTVLYVNWML